MTKPVTSLSRFEAFLLVRDTLIFGIIALIYFQINFCNLDTKYTFPNVFDLCEVNSLTATVLFQLSSFVTFVHINTNRIHYQNTINTFHQYKADKDLQSTVVLADSFVLSCSIYHNLLSKHYYIKNITTFKPL